MRTLILVALSCLLSVGCASTGTKLPDLPKVVDHVIEVPKPLPGWATIPLPLPPLKDGKVGSHLERENALENLLGLANCHRMLSDKISRGEIADSNTCSEFVVPAVP